MQQIPSLQRQRESGQSRGPTEIRDWGSLTAEIMQITPLACFNDAPTAHLLQPAVPRADGAASPLGQTAWPLSDPEHQELRHRTQANTENAAAGVSHRLSILRPE